MISGRRAGDTGGAGWGLPTPQELLVGADRPDADLLIDDVYTAEAEGTGREGSAPGRRPHAHPRPGSLSPPRGWLEPRPSPVEADFVETLLAGLVYGVEAGARVLLLAAVWVTDGVGAELVAHSWGPPPAAPPEGLALGARNPCTLRPSLDTHTYATNTTHTHKHTTPLDVMEVSEKNKKSV